jgi:hypothetical protein
MTPVCVAGHVDVDLALVELRADVDVVTNGERMNQCLFDDDHLNAVANFGGMCAGSICGSICAPHDVQVHHIRAQKISRVE